MIRVAVAGCGNVSRSYLPDLLACPVTEVVALCDVRPERASAAAEEFGVPRSYDAVELMLRETPFDMLVNLTAMPFHAPLNRLALEAGKHVYCEKPIATTLADGRELLEIARHRGVCLRGAPNVVTSPAFAAMARAIADGEIGKPCAAHARYGSMGPDWGAWFFQEGGGSLFDLGVYNITTLTGLLGPARAVVALSGIAIPIRRAEGRDVATTAEDNTMLLLDFGDACFGCVQTGFVYRAFKSEWTLEICGTEGNVTLLGHDWAPRGIDVFSRRTNAWERRAEDQGGYHWRSGASYLARCLEEGREPAMTGEHALHVLEVMLAAMESARTGRRVEVESGFPWPVGDGESGP
jgi:predicted dehydrogenase